MLNKKLLYNVTLAVSIILVIISICALVHVKHLSASTNEINRVLYPKNSMMVNQISDDTVVITTLNFEDAVKEINQCKDQFKEENK